jgi:hypothetical protein
MMLKTHNCENQAANSQYTCPSESSTSTAAPPCLDANDVICHRCSIHLQTELALVSATFYNTPTRRMLCNML